MTFIMCEYNMCDPLVFQGFWLEVTEQKSKVEAVIKSGRQVAMETQWPQGTGESLRSQFSGLEERWKKLWAEGEQWGKLLQSVHPELEKFQVQFEWVRERECVHGPYSYVPNMNYIII